MSSFMLNPEFLRNARIQMRPGRIIAAAVICAAISVTMWYLYFSHSIPTTRIDNARALLRFVLGLQVCVLLIGGGIYELLAVHREKELNTFDYQRVTRLTSFELAIGKLFGAPVLAYFVTVCLIPIGLVAAFVAGVSIKMLLEAYVILFVGCIAFHLLALLISMALGRGVSAIAILPYLIFVAVTSIDFALDDLAPGQDWGSWAIHTLNPFAAAEVFRIGVPMFSMDSFFAVPLPHVVVLLVLYATFGAVFLLAVVRNLKRDPAVYQLYSPVQVFGFAIYLTVLVLGFLNWKAPLGDPIFQHDGSQYHQVGVATLPPLGVLTMVLVNIFWIFAFLGLILLRNREHVRRRIKILGTRAASLWADFWPAVYPLVGIVLAGIATVELIRTFRHPPSEEWSWSLALLYVVFVALWVARDLLYLQWMGLRRVRRPLAVGMLFLIVFYTCTGIIVSTATASARPTLAPFAAALIPGQIFRLSVSDFAARPQFWLASLGILVFQALLFAFLHRQKLNEFLDPAVGMPSGATPPADAAKLGASSL